MLPAAYNVSCFYLNAHNSYIDQHTVWIIVSTAFGQIFGLGSFKVFLGVTEPISTLHLCTFCTVGKIIAQTLLVVVVSLKTKKKKK